MGTTRATWIQALEFIRRRDVVKKVADLAGIRRKPSNCFEDASPSWQPHQHRYPYLVKPSRHNTSLLPGTGPEIGDYFGLQSMHTMGQSKHRGDGGGAMTTEITDQATILTPEETTESRSHR